MKNILVTGGAGYIGIHTCLELVNSGYNVLVLDNYSNSTPCSLDRMKEITGKTVIKYKGDICDENILTKIFSDNKIDAVIHFAGLKSVGESFKAPLEYYSNNVSGTVNLCKVMNRFSVKKLVFSSSATVYGNNVPPYTESMDIGNPVNPYGRTKLMIEEILSDLYKSDNKWSISLLRYFNPIGAHESGKLGEDPLGIPNNIMPFISRVAVGKLPELTVFGDDYNTVDGTCIRDYIHVMDLAQGHIKALDKMFSHQGFGIFNLGTGKGYSVLELIKAFEKASGREIKYRVGDRREGDLPVCYADVSKSYDVLGWKAELGIDKMCEDTWRWQSMNPNGYQQVDGDK